MKNKKFFEMPDTIFGINSGLIKLLIPPLALFLFFLTSLGWLIFPKIESIKSLISSSEKIKTQISLTEEKRNYLLSIDQEQLERDSDYLSSAVLKEKNSYLLLGVIEDITSKYNYNINSFSLSVQDLKGVSTSLKLSDKNIATKMPLNIEISGPTENFIDLIKNLENSLPILFIDNMDIGQKGGNSILKMMVSSYYLPDKIDINSENLTLNDLKLTKDESDLLAKISIFEKTDSLNGTIEKTDRGTFVEYNRDNPF